jgi:hypothetical protein
MFMTGVSNLLTGSDPFAQAAEALRRHGAFDWSAWGFHVCHQCGVRLHSYSGFFDKLEACGIKVNRSKEEAQGILDGTMEPWHRETYEYYLDRRGYKCGSCLRTFCTKCLMGARQHRQTEGRACFQCGGSIARLHRDEKPV